MLNKMNSQKYVETAGLPDNGIKDIYKMLFIAID